MQTQAAVVDCACRLSLLMIVPVSYHYFEDSVKQSINTQYLLNKC